MQAIFKMIAKKKSAERRNEMKASMMVGVVVALHVMAIGTIVFIQGCGTRRAVVEPPPAPVMPPQADSTSRPAGQPKPFIKPPVPVEPAPSISEPSQAKIYIIQKGDYLSKIAKRVGVSSKEIAELNNIKDPNKIRVGQKLILPEYATVTTRDTGSSRPASKSKPAASVPTGEGMVYVVQPGDSLSKIAVKHGSSVKAIREANKLKGDLILVGQKLHIPGVKRSTMSKSAIKPVKKTRLAPRPTSKPVPEPAKPAPSLSLQQDAQTSVSDPEADTMIAAPEAVPDIVPVASAQEEELDYRVQDGDTIEDIAKLFLVSKEDIVSLNNLQEGEEVKPGQKLKIPSPTP